MSKKILTLLIILILVTAIPLILSAMNKNQNSRSKAAAPVLPNSFIQQKIPIPAKGGFGVYISPSAAPAVPSTTPSTKDLIISNAFDGASLDLKTWEVYSSPSSRLVNGLIKIKNNKLTVECKRNGNMSEYFFCGIASKKEIIGDFTMEIMIDSFVSPITSINTAEIQIFRPYISNGTIEKTGGSYLAWVKDKNKQYVYLYNSDIDGNSQQATSIIDLNNPSTVVFKLLRKNSKLSIYLKKDNGSYQLIKEITNGYPGAGNIRIGMTMWDVNNDPTSVNFSKFIFIGKAAIL